MIDAIILFYTGEAVNHEQDRADFVQYGLMEEEKRSHHTKKTYSTQKIKHFLYREKYKQYKKEYIQLIKKFKKNHGRKRQWKI